MSAIGTWDDVFGAVSEELRQIAGQLRALIRESDPAAVEVARPGYNAVSFGSGTEKMSGAYAYLMPQKDRVNLGFYQGTSLPDPAGLLEGGGKALRHVKVRSLAAAGAPALAALITAAVAGCEG